MKIKQISTTATMSPTSEGILLLRTFTIVTEGRR